MEFEMRSSRIANIFVIANVLLVCICSTFVVDANPLLEERREYHVERSSNVGRPSVTGYVTAHSSRTSNAILKNEIINHSELF